MKGYPPSAGRDPLWARKEFRWLLLVSVMGVSAIAVLVFEIHPMMEARKRPEGQAAVKVKLPDPGVIRYDGILNKLEDWTAIEDEVDTVPYGQLVRHLSKTSRESLAKESLRVPYKSFMENPEAWRGQTVRIDGIYMASNPQRLNNRAPGVEWVHRTYIADYSGDEGYVVDLLDPPPALHRRDLVRVDAVLAKIGTYETQDDHWQTAPFLVGRAITLVEEGAASSWMPSWVVFGTAGASVLAAAYLSWRIFRGDGPSGAKKVMIGKHLIFRGSRNA